MEQNINVLVGKTLINIYNIDDDTLIFCADDDTSYKMYHVQDCCEDVRIEEIIGNLDDLIGSPILEAEEVNSEGHSAPEYYESYTWTFYKFSTNKGSVTLRWLGTSNGYYSESVEFERITN